MKYSIIIPVYNGEKYLRECLDSVLCQEGDFECIIVDDGSVDNSPKICDEYMSADSRIKVFHNDNHGVSYTRNFALDRAEGDYVCFVDCDDVISKNLLSCMDKSGVDCDVVMFSYTRGSSDLLCSDSGDVSVQTVPPDALLDKTIYDGARGVGYNCSTVWAKLYKRSLLCNTRFVTDIAIGEDKVFNFSAFSRAHSVCYIDKIMYYCRTHQGSVMQRYAKNYVSQAQRSFEEFDTMISNSDNKQHFEKMLSNRAVLIMKNIIILNLCHKSNTMSYKERKSVWDDIKHNSLSGKYFAMCDGADIESSDRFFLYAYKNLGFFRIDLMTKYKLFKAMEYAIYKLK